MDTAKGGDTDGLRNRNGTDARMQAQSLRRFFMKKCLSIILSLAILFVTLVNPALAGGVIGSLETDIQMQGFTELSVRTVISKYFLERKAYLQGIADTISVAVAPMVADEDSHKEVLTNANAVLINSTVEISEILLGDYVAEVIATESATFAVDGEIKQENVVHAINVYLNNAGDLVIGSDGYAEETSAFVSASYISAESVAYANTAAIGSPICIVETAMNEIGTTTGADGTTIYGRWYGNLFNDTSFYSAPWCTSFVAWCANHASVPTSVIPLTAYAPTMATFFNNAGRYYHSESGGGNYTPQPGDIIFIGVNANDTFYSPGHVGIVCAVYGKTVYYTEGNVTYYVNGVKTKRVCYSTKSLTATDIIAFANPNYAADTHTVTQWECDDCYHWAYCEACGVYISEQHKNVEIYTNYWACEICGRTPGNYDY